MSHDPRHVSSPPRPPASGAADPTRPRAGFYRARIVEIKRRGPSSRASARPEEEEPNTKSPLYRASPPTKVDGSDTANMSSSPHHAGTSAPSDGTRYPDSPPPPPPHSPSQRSLSISRGSYMENEFNAPPSRSPHFSQPFRQSAPSPPRHQHQHSYDSRASPVTAIRAARATRNFRYETEGDFTPRRLPPPPPPREREEYDPRRLLPTAVRPPQAFQFELEEESPQHHSSELHIPGRFPSSPNSMEINETLADGQTGGFQEHVPKFRPKAGSYRELEPWELGMIYSNPTPYQAPASSADHVQQNSTDPAEPFIFERSPWKEDHDGSNKPVAASRQAAYNAPNPALEAEKFPLLRRLGADERYATSFRTGNGEATQSAGPAGWQGVVKHGAAEDHGRVDMPMVDVRTTGAIDVRALEMERRRAERSSRR